MKPFNILIWIIITLILVFITINIFQNLLLSEDLITELNNTIKFAETQEMLGKSILLYSKETEKNFILSKNSFDTVKRSIAIECTDPNICCPINEKCEKIEWNYTMAQFKEQRRISYYVRCVEEKIMICRIFFGYSPAQAKIEKIEIIEQEGINTKIKVVVSNIGKINLLLGENTIELYKKTKGAWQNTEDFFIPQTINLLLEKQQHIFIWELETKTLGEYQIKTTFKGSNAGFDTKTLDFNITQNINCETSSIQEIIFDNAKQKNIQIHNCNNCNFSYECVKEWNEKKPNINWFTIDKDKIYCEINNNTGKCN